MTKHSLKISTGKVKVKSQKTEEYNDTDEWSIMSTEEIKCGTSPGLDKNTLELLKTAGCIVKWLSIVKPLHMYWDWSETLKE